MSRGRGHSDLAVAFADTSASSRSSGEYGAFDYLVAADDGQGDERARPVAETTWRCFMDRATEEDASGIGRGVHLVDLGRRSRARWRTRCAKAVLRSGRLGMSAEALRMWIRQAEVDVRRASARVRLCGLLPPH